MPSLRRITLATSLLRGAEDGFRARWISYSPSIAHDTFMRKRASFARDRFRSPPPGSDLREPRDFFFFLFFFADRTPPSHLHGIPAPVSFVLSLRHGQTLRDS